MAVPLAHALAGRRTDFAFTFSISVNATLAATTTLAAAGFGIQTHRVKRYKTRTRELETRLGVGGKNLSGSHGKASGQARQFPGIEPTTPEGQ
jgi:hypothetical protein